jgi:hypothetical protein
MARQLKARKPDAGQVTKPKVLIYGPPGVGKTTVSLDFPQVYFIDTEGGASLPAYQRKLADSGGVYFGKEEGSQDFGTVINEIQTLATVEHPYLTLVIDSFSKLYNLAAAQAELTVGNDFGKDKKEAQRPTRQLMSWLERLDMNVVLICHAKDKWERKGGQLVSTGQTFDGWDKMEYDFHLALYIDRGGARVSKTRLEGFPRDATFPWSFAEFEKRAGGAVMLRPPKPVVVAGPEQVAEITRLLGLVKMPEGWEEKVLNKAGVTSWAEMEADKCQACIDKLLESLKPGNAEAA